MLRYNLIRMPKQKHCHTCCPCWRIEGLDVTLCTVVLRPKDATVGSPIQCCSCVNFLKRDTDIDKFLVIPEWISPEIHRYWCRITGVQKRAWSNRTRALPWARLCQDGSGQVSSDTLPVSTLRGEAQHTIRGVDDNRNASTYLNFELLTWL